MTKRKTPPEPEYDLPDDNLGCIRSMLFFILVECVIFGFIYILTLIR